MGSRYNDILRHPKKYRYKEIIIIIIIIIIIRLLFVDSPPYAPVGTELVVFSDNCNG